MGLRLKFGGALQKSLLCSAWLLSRGKTSLTAELGSVPWVCESYPMPMPQKPCHALQEKDEPALASEKASSS